jgi:hypothetical protein
LALTDPRTRVVATVVSVPSVRPEVKSSDQLLRRGAGVTVPLARKSVIRSVQVPLRTAGVAPS